MFTLKCLYHATTNFSQFILYRRLLSTTYKSSISLYKLYPKSSLSIIAPIEIPLDPTNKFDGFIPINKLRITYSRSSGPGGQHVNVVNTKVDIRFHVESADWLQPDIRNKILELYKTRINKDGYLVVRSEKTRSQIYNQADALTTLRQMIRSAASALESKPEPSKETLFQIKKRQEKANIERLFKKRMHSEKKADRQDSFQ